MMSSPCAVLLPIPPKFKKNNNGKTPLSSTEVTSFFHRLKYQFLCGIRNRRLDHLIDVLLNKTDKYFNIIQDLQWNLYKMKLKTKTGLVQLSGSWKAY
ncbi:hypothetical protein PHYPO_G00113880 [Pangasianodon hypophthalmus]|uniref:Uncharacterized protein n=1 Tax=Pangasianodon hypophthalmus TaxID=310915 RepID=A0A5N5L3F2_PANHP|nr:hypothetical protein PHYPO_G00113880 [Pangasianodon hypophthalmus]